MAEPSPLKAIERSMTVVRRRQNRRSLRELADLRSWDRNDLALIPALEAIDDHGSDATVGAVASILGLDPSRSSRMVSAGIEAGYVTRVASQSDGRRVHLRLTAQGAARVIYAHEYRQKMIDRAMRGWSQRDRDQFARLLTRFTDALNADL